MDQPDKITQTRGSMQERYSFFNRVSRIFCPCISLNKLEDRNNSNYFVSNIENTSERSSVEVPYKEVELQGKKTLQFSPFNLSTKYNHDFEFEEVYSAIDRSQNKHKESNFPTRSSHIDRQTLSFLNHMDKMTYTKKKEWYNFPIYKYKQGELHLVGKQGKKMLIEISTVKLQPSPLAVQKQFLSKCSENQTCKVLDDFWKVRYYYFQKFDQGIQIDKQSLRHLTPEIVSDYIAGKCYECKVALDAFSGIGHHATKLGTVCQKVMCVQQDSKKYHYLINNAKCYEIYNIELFMKPFLEINLKSKVDVVLLHPPILNQIYLHSSTCEVKHFKPNLSELIKKSLQISNNIVMLLPHNISLKDICYEFSKAAQQLQKVFGSCSLKVEKIFFKNNLSYVAVFFGCNVQSEIKINAQLGFIYKMLKNPQEKAFKHKKLIKHLRQKYGMIKLLNFVSAARTSQSDKQDHMQRFIDYVRQNKLILEHKLINLLNDQRNTSSKPTSRQNTSEFQSSYASTSSPKKISGYSLQQNEQQKIDQEQEQQTVTERTQSFYSNVSGFSGLNNKRNTIINSSKRTNKGNNNSESFDANSFSSSIVIKKITEGSLQKDSKSPASPITTNGNSLAQRHTLNLRKYEKQLNESTKQKLKKTLLSNQG